MIAWLLRHLPWAEQRTAVEAAGGPNEELRSMQAVLLDRSRQLRDDAAKLRAMAEQEGA